MYSPFKKLHDHFTPDIFELHRRANEHAQRSEWVEETLVRCEIWKRDKKDPVALYQLGESYNILEDVDTAERCFHLSMKLGYPQENHDNMYG